MPDIPRIVIAAPASGHGKTTVTMGLLAAYAARGTAVVGCKVGPDYIDPGYHALASGRPGRNLDPVLVGEDLIAPLFTHGGAGAELAIVEGVMGLFDGRTGAGSYGSTAHVARLLRAPVVVVVDAAAQGRTAAAIVHGLRTFEPGVRIAGVILNRVGSARHAALLGQAFEEIGTPVLGTLFRDEAVTAPSRHLGLVPAVERHSAAQESMRALAALVTKSVDLDAVLATARSAPPLTTTPWSPDTAVEGAPNRAGDARAERPVIAVAGGPAFSFAYAETTELLAAAGAEVVGFDPLRDARLPEGTGGLVVGGGFPEVYGRQLAENTALHAAVARLAAAGAPIAAECAGLLWLCRTLDDLPMCGVLDADAVMTNRLTLGYRDAVALTGGWLADPGTRVTGHEFHKSEVRPRPGSAGDRAWRWAGGAPEGFVSGRVHASYLHLHWAGQPEIAYRLVAVAKAAACV